MKKITISALILTASAIFTSCFNPVLNNIRDEVALSASSVQGRVLTLARATINSDEYIIAANGNIAYSKINADKKGNESWTYVKKTNITPPEFHYGDRTFSGEAIVNTATDTNNVYIMTLVYTSDSSENVVSERKLYYTPISDLTKNDVPWTLISGFKPHLLFCTNDVDSTKRIAYVKTEDKKTWLLNGGQAPVEVPEANGMYGAVNTGNGVFFSETPAVAKHYNKDIIYKGKDKAVIYSTDGGTTWSEKTQLSAKPTCLSLAGDSLLVGTSNGITKIILNTDGTLGQENKTWGNNATATLSKSYEILTLLKISPETNHDKGCTYASMDFEGSSYTYTNICVWSYEEERGDWNRE